MTTRGWIAGVQNRDALVPAEGLAAHYNPPRRYTHLFRSAILLAAISLF